MNNIFLEKLLLKIVLLSFMDLLNHRKVVMLMLTKYLLMIKCSPISSKFIDEILELFFVLYLV